VGSEKSVSCFSVSVADALLRVATEGNCLGPSEIPIDSVWHTEKRIKFDQLLKKKKEKKKEKKKKKKEQMKERKKKNKEEDEQEERRILKACCCGFFCAQAARPVGHGGRGGHPTKHPAAQTEQGRPDSGAPLVERDADDDDSDDGDDGGDGGDGGDVRQPQATSQVKRPRKRKK